MNPLFPKDPNWTYGSLLPLARGPNGELSPALPDMIRGPLNNIFGATQAFDPSSDMSPDERASAVMRGSVDLGMGGLGAAPRAALTHTPSMMHMMVPVGNNERALLDSLERSGATPTEIFSKTRLSRGPEGQPRREISDTKLDYTDHPDVQISGPKGAEVLNLPTDKSLPLAKVLSHPRLFDSVPELRDWRIRAFDEEDPAEAQLANGVVGLADPDEKLIRIKNGLPARPATFGDTNNSLAHITHEVQHAVQYENNWAVGGSPMMFISPLHLGRMQALEQSKKIAELDAFLDHGIDLPLVTKLQNAGTIGQLSDYETSQFNKWTALTPGVRNKIFQGYTKNDQDLGQLQSQWNSAIQHYLSLGGENESNLTALRMAMAKTGLPGVYNSPQSMMAGYRFDQTVVKQDQMWRGAPVQMPMSGEPTLQFANHPQVDNGVSPYAPGKFSFMFTNPFAPRAKQDFLDLERGGVDPTTLKMTTGTHRGADGMLRQEVPDVGVSLSKIHTPTDEEGNVAFDSQKAKMLGNVIQHPELYKAEPWLKKLEVLGSMDEEDPLFDDGRTVAYVGSNEEFPSHTGFIVKSGSDPKHVLDDFIPAIQHAIQHKNGWNVGQIDPRDLITHEHLAGFQAALESQDPKQIAYYDQLLSRTGEAAHSISGNAEAASTAFRRENGYMVAPWEDPGYPRHQLMLPGSARYNRPPSFYPVTMPRGEGPTGSLPVPINRLLQLFQQADPKAQPLRSVFAPKIISDSSKK